MSQQEHATSTAIQCVFAVACACVCVHRYEYSFHYWTILIMFAYIIALRVMGIVFLRYVSFLKR